MLNPHHYTDEEVIILLVLYEVKFLPLHQAAAGAQAGETLRMVFATREILSSRCGIARGPASSPRGGLGTFRLCQGGEEPLPLVAFGVLGSGQARPRRGPETAPAKLCQAQVVCREVT